MNIFFFIFLNSANFAEPENTNFILFAFKPKITKWIKYNFKRVLV